MSKTVVHYESYELKQPLSDGYPETEAGENDTEGKTRKKKWSKKKKFALISILACLLVIGLLIYFLFPRTPKLKEKYIEEDVFTLSNLVGLLYELNLRVHVVYEVKNENYVSFEIESLDVDVYHVHSDGEEWDAGSIKKGSKTFKPRKTSDYDLDVVIGGESKEDGMVSLFTTCLLSSQANLRFKGVAHAKYLGMKKDVDVDFTKLLECKII
eukprot:TRINITY_DN3166_c0_g1_i1.p1 TRINITY_DN3166_c0_g1~~TRINITY_DN3166_c0_g1_i1.p1  ORF type:complete len:212 (-),score=29.42 TRINITY_DN3166_c0_g1_i1:218-853(-)